MLLLSFNALLLIFLDLLNALSLGLADLLASFRHHPL